MDINNLTDFEILVFLKENRNLLVTELSKKEEIEDNLGREFTEEGWTDFNVYVDQFFKDVKEDFINKILEAYKNGF